MEVTEFGRACVLWAAGAKALEQGPGRGLGFVWVGNEKAGTRGGT